MHVVNVNVNAEIPYYSLEGKPSGSSDENWENKKHYVCSLHEEKYLVLFRTAQCVLWADLKAISQIFFVSHFYLVKTVLSAMQLYCALQWQGQCPYEIFFCLELPYLKAEHLLKAFWIHSHLLWRQRICLVQLSPSLLLSHKSVVWFTSSSYAWRLILLASAPV